MTTGSRHAEVAERARTRNTTLVDAIAVEALVEDSCDCCRDVAISEPCNLRNRCLDSNPVFSHPGTSGAPISVGSGAFGQLDLSLWRTTAIRKAMKCPHLIGGRLWAPKHVTEGCKLSECFWKVLLIGSWDYET